MIVLRRFHVFLALVSCTALCAHGLAPLQAQEELIEVPPPPPPPKLTPRSSDVVYAIYVPKYIRPGFDFSFTISVVKAKTLIDVTAVLHTNDLVTTFQSSTRIQPGNSALLTVGKLPLGYQGSRKFELIVTGTDSQDNEELFTNSTTDIRFSAKSMSIFIQTDKAIYKPGQMIKFRGLCLDSDLRPLSGKTTYKVSDPNNNIVLLEPNITLNHGVAGGELLLNKDATEGNWKIEYEYKGYKESLDVEVKPYKLPKFEVNVEAPSYIHTGSPGFTVTVKATYTFGQPVAGSAEITIKNSYSNNPESEITKTVSNFNGETSFYITKNELDRSLDLKEYYGQRVDITGYVTERLTGIKFKDTASLTTERTNIKIEVLSKPPVAKPGLLYQALVRVTEKDGKLLMPSDISKNDLIVEVNYRRSYNYLRPIELLPSSDSVATTRATTTTPPLPEKEVVVYKIPPNGVVPVNIEIPNINFDSVDFNTYVNTTDNNNRYYNRWSATKAESPSNSYLQITTRGDAARGEVAVGSRASVVVRTNNPIKSFRIMIIARGEVVKSTRHTVSGVTYSNSFPYSFDVTSNMVPSVLVLASYVADEDDEIVADYTKINVALALENQISIDSSSDSYDAGSKVSLRVQTSPKSYVGIRAIDQSVLLLKSGNDITEDRVRDDVSKYSNGEGGFDFRPFGRGFFWFPYSSGAKDATEVFSKADVIVLTNALLYDYPERPFFLPLSVARVPDRNLEIESVAFSGPKSVPKTLTKVRKLFPETWIWDHGKTRSDGSVMFNTTAPDTITSWIISAFSLSDETGLGIADPYKLTVFRNFFISLNLPLKITRGEIIIVQAIVFNYFDQDLDVNLRLNLDNFKTGVELLRPNNDPAAGPIRSLKVAAKGSVSVKFPLRINLLGEVPLGVSATSSRAADAVVRKVFVRPEGIQQCYSASVLANRAIDDIGNSSESLMVKIPSGIVPGSEKVYLYVYGDILGSTMSNLGKLLKTPGGCGEQNMLNFAPDVFVTLYLNNVGQLTADTREKAYQHFTDGYMTELKYKHKDGSYSAFGERDESGSTWLTAFVAKCFIYARELRPELVEPRIINEAITFLLKQQRKDGSFAEPGRVIHKDMQGGVDSNVTMTAYVLIALSETPYPARVDNVIQAMQNAKAYLEKNSNNILRDAYALSLVTYALQLTDSPYKDAFLIYFNRLAVNKGGYKYWHKDTAGASTYARRWRPPYYSPPTNDIEMTAYGLLIYTARQDLDGAAPILRWLVSKQNSLGGYSSTQDTVIAVQALSKVAELLAQRRQQLTLQIQHTGDSSFARTFQLTPANSIVFNTVELKPVDGSIVVTSSGSGLGVAQLSVCYNIPNDPYSNEPFNCSVQVSSKDSNSANVNFCCSLRKGEDEATGMFLFEIGLLNGFAVDKNEEEKRNEDAKLVEVDDDSVNIYYNELKPKQRLCANVVLFRYQEVAAVKPATLSAFVYYKPDRKVTRLYNVDGISKTGVCEVCGSDCIGCPAPVLQEWTKWTPCVTFCKPSVSTRIRNCVDPSLKKVVDFTKCGLSAPLIRHRNCSANFPCPDTSDSLWSSPPSCFNRRLTSSCWFTNDAKGRAVGPRTGIPGTILSGSGGHMECYNHYLRSINPVTGFTYSFLVKPSRYPIIGAYTFLYLGSNAANPAIVFEKIWWKSEFRFKVEVGEKGYLVNKISLSEIPVGRWSQVVLVWDPAGDAKVYINGQLPSQRSSIQNNKVSSSKVKTTKLQSYRNFYLGKHQTKTPWLQGVADGTISALYHWNKPLTPAEVRALYEFYKSLLTSTIENPVISIRQLRSFLPVSLKRCIKKPSTLAELYTCKKQEFCPPQEPIILF